VLFTDHGGLYLLSPMSQRFNLEVVDDILNCELVIFSLIDSRKNRVLLSWTAPLRTLTKIVVVNARGYFPMNVLKTCWLLASLLL
jgi:hypothetical protein